MPVSGGLAGLQKGAMESDEYDPITVAVKGFFKKDPKKDAMAEALEKRKQKVADESQEQTPMEETIP